MTEEHRMPLERLAQIEEKLSTNIRNWSIILSGFLTISTTAYFVTTAKVLENAENIAGLNSSVMTLAETQALHVFDDPKHQNNTGRVNDNAADIRELSREIRATQVLVERIRAAVEAAHGRPVVVGDQ